jgi:replication-associated recombination protein RarA
MERMGSTDEVSNGVSNARPTTLSFARRFVPATMDRMCISPPIAKFIDRIVAGSHPMSTRNSVIVKAPAGRGKTTLMNMIQAKARESGIDVLMIDINALNMPQSTLDAVTEHSKKSSTKYKLVLLDNIDVCDNDYQNNISRYVDVFANTLFVSSATICHNMDTSLRTKSNIVAIPAYTTDEISHTIETIFDQITEVSHQMSKACIASIAIKSSHNMRTILNCMETIYLFNVTTGKPLDDEVVREITNINMDDQIRKFLARVRGGEFEAANRSVLHMAHGGKSNIDILFSIFNYIVKNPVLTDIENLRITGIIGRYIVHFNARDDRMYMNFVIHEMMRILSVGGVGGAGSGTGGGTGVGTGGC